MKVSGVIYIDLDIIIEIHRIQIEEHGGAIGARSLDGLKSAISQPQAIFGNEDLHVARLQPIYGLKKKILDSNPENVELCLFNYLNFRYVY